jgi:Domain of unknown function (DUF6799)
MYTCAFEWYIEIFFLAVLTCRAKEHSLMAKHRVVALTAVVLLVVSLFASRLMAAEMNGVMMKDGKMMMMTDGKASGPMDHDMTMSDGTKVMKDGMVKMKDGKEMHMKDGQMMMMDGKIMEGGKAMEMMKK